MARSVLRLDKGDVSGVQIDFSFELVVLPYSILVNLGCVFSREAYVFV